MVYGDFQKTHPFEKRREEADRIRRRYPDRIPIICEAKTQMDFKLDKTKYLVPKDLTVGQFQYVIRKKLKCSPESALFLFAVDKEGQYLLPTAQLISTAYENHKQEDGFVYFVATSENTFGTY